MPPSVVLKERIGLPNNISLEISYGWEDFEIPSSD